ncbi:MAG: hypothetical protein K2F57_07505 [Candidatus Gastranaerophilales bacterium]|nr:hypothetical protein [Candidatus Gastranaerophilales bacterium]
MTDINFTSTYRIPITQAGVNSAKKGRLKELIESYPNGLVGKSKTGHARISLPDSEDSSFIAKLKKIGYKVYQKFEGENISKDEIDVFIKERLDSRNYHQKGKNMERLSRSLKEQRRYERSLDKKTISETFEETIQAEPQQKIKTTGVYEELELTEKDKNIIRKSPNYIKLRDEEGPEFADAVYFGIDK